MSQQCLLHPFAISVCLNIWTQNHPKHCTCLTGTKRKRMALEEALWSWVRCWKAVVFRTTNVAICPCLSRQPWRPTLEGEDLYKLLEVSETSSVEAWKLGKRSTRATFLMILDMNFKDKFFKNIWLHCDWFDGLFNLGSMSQCFIKVSPDLPANQEAVPQDGFAAPSGQARPKDDFDCFALASS